VPGDKEIAKRTITFLENRRVIFGEFRLHVDHEEDCLRSANEIRSFLTEQIDAARSEELKASLRAMRAAARKFADAAESHLDTISFGKAFGDFRTLMGVQIAGASFWGVCYFRVFRSRGEAEVLDGGGVVAG
jgi:hypothetical protein